MTYDQQLIAVSVRPVGGEFIQTVNARDLHAFLEAGKVFGAWITERIEQYGFLAGKDFEVFSEIGNNPLGGRPAKEYALALDMAKELSMVERNEKGKQARRYFIECERRAQSSSSPSLSLSDPAALRSALLGYTERVIALEATVQEQAPKVQFYDAVTESKECQTIQEVAKVLGMGPNRLFESLRKERILMADNLPFQRFIDAGHFRVVRRQYTDHDGESHTYSRTMVTGKGLAFIQKRLQSGAEQCA